MDKKVILVIDDETDLTDLMKEILESTGEYEAQIASDGDEGIRMFREVKPDIVFLDYVMPKKRGDEVLKFISEQKDLCDIPIILMSGLSNDAVYEVKNIEEGVSGKNEMGLPSSEPFPNDDSVRKMVKVSLPKPFTKDQLLLAVDVSLNKE